MADLEELNFENPDTCPNCGQFVGQESICPYCGAMLSPDEDGLNAFDEDQGAE